MEVQDLSNTTKPIASNMLSHLSPLNRVAKNFKRINGSLIGKDREDPSIRQQSQRYLQSDNRPISKRLVHPRVPLHFYSPLVSVNQPQLSFLHR